MLSETLPAQFEDEFDFDSYYETFKIETAGASDEELLRSFNEAFTVTLKSIMRMAAIIKKFDEQGKDLSAISKRLNGLFHNLRRVAYGKFYPEALLRFGGKNKLANRIAQLPVCDQKRLAKGELVKLLVHETNGTRTHRLADPLSMTDDQINLVFAPDHIRDEAEQALRLDSRLSKVFEPIPERIGGIEIDEIRDGLVIKKSGFVPLDHIIQALGALQKRKQSLKVKENVAAAK